MMLYLYFAYSHNFLHESFNSYEIYLLYLIFPLPKIPINLPSIELQWVILLAWMLIAVSNASYALFWQGRAGFPKIFEMIQSDCSLYV